MVPKRKTICLLGPLRGGKTTLLRTMRSCLREHSHGYQPGYVSSFKLREITQTEFDDGLPDSHQTVLTRFTNGHYSREEAFFNDPEAELDKSGREGSSGPSDGTLAYFFSLEWTAGDLFPTDVWQQPSNTYLEIVDAAGELSTPSGPTPDEWEPHRIALDNKLRITHAVILVAPSGDGSADPWAPYLLDALEKLARIPAENRALERVVAVFSKYDRLFARCGPESVDIAVRRHAALYAVRRELRYRRWLQHLSLLGRMLDTDIRLTVASALGFTRSFGTPNADPNTGRPTSAPARFRTKNDSPGLDSAPLWRPFLTADPFIFAATGISNVYMFTFDEVGGEMGLKGSFGGQGDPASSRRNTVNPAPAGGTEPPNVASWDQRLDDKGTPNDRTRGYPDFDTRRPPGEVGKPSFLERVRQFFNANKS